MKWIYNSNNDELLNTDTGARFVIWCETGVSTYEAKVVFYGPLVGTTSDGYEIHAAYSVLYQGTVSECEAYLKVIANRSNAFVLNPGNGTERAGHCQNCGVELAQVGMDFCGLCGRDVAKRDTGATKSISLDNIPF